jgi:hypothetical protein
MRFLVKVSIPVESGNQAVNAGTLGRTIESILADQNPEAAYFADENGRRTGYLFLNMADTSQIPVIAEPWFLALNAQIEIHPAMNLEDLKKAGPQMGQISKKYGAHAKAAGTTR